MKNTMRKLLALSMTMAIMLTGTTNVGAADTHTIAVENNKTVTNIDISGDTFGAYQIMSVNENVKTAYVVNKDYIDFFNNYTTEIKAYNTDSPTPNAEVALNTLIGEDYNYAVINYLNSLNFSDRATLASELNDYIHTNNISATKTATVPVEADDATQTADIISLAKGYYFVMNAASTDTGLSVNADGTFVDLARPGTTPRVVINLKQSKPTIEKEILHEDNDGNGAWDKVDDSQIGDTVDFRITSTLPTEAFLKEFKEAGKQEDGSNYTYKYIITDIMSAGLTSNENVKIYTDIACTDKTLLKEDTDYTISYATNSDTDDATDEFTITVKVKELYEAGNLPTTIYIKYSAVVNEAATVAPSCDQNSTKLEYSNDPSSDKTGTTDESIVKHFTFEMDVTKIGDEGQALAGAEFGLFVTNKAGQEIQLPLKKGEADATTGVVPYYYDETATAPEGNKASGFIITEIHNVGEGEEPAKISRFKIFGLDDEIEYTLKELAAPEGYNHANDYRFTFHATYTADNTPNITFNKDSDSSITIINREEVYLPSTGGMGTVLFPVIGGGLMLGAAAVLLISKRKNAVK